MVRQVGDDTSGAQGLGRSPTTVTDEPSRPDVNDRTLRYLDDRYPGLLAVRDARAVRRPAAGFARSITPRHGCVDQGEGGRFRPPEVERYVGSHTDSDSPPALIGCGHERGRRDRIDPSGVFTLRHNSRVHHIGVGRRHAGTRILAHDLDIRVLTTNGELIRELRLNPDRDYQPQPKRERCPEHL